MDRMEQTDVHFEKVDAKDQKACQNRNAGACRSTPLQPGENLDQLAKETDHKINALIDSQQRTEASLRAFLDSSKGRNGGSN